MSGAIKVRDMQQFSVPYGRTLIHLGQRRLDEIKRVRKTFKAAAESKMGRKPQMNSRFAA